MTAILKRLTGIDILDQSVRLKSMSRLNDIKLESDKILNVSVPSIRASLFDLDKLDLTGLNLPAPKLVKSGLLSQIQKVFERFNSFL